MANENDELIEKLIKEVEVKKSKVAELEKERFSYVTNCIIEFNNERTNLRVCTKSKLLTLVSELLSFNHNLSVAAQFLDVEHDEPSIGGYEIEHWLNDIKKAYREKDLRDEKSDLLKMEKELKELFTDDKKVSNKLEEFSKKLKK